MSARARTVVIVLVGLVLVLCGCASALMAGGIAWYAITSRVERHEERAAYDVPPVWFDLRAEGTTLHRSEEPLRAEVEYRNVGWRILADGALILHRNAEGETRYDVFGCEQGTVLTAYVTAWYDGAYHQASDEVRITCR